MSTPNRSRLIDPSWFVLASTMTLAVVFVGGNMLYGVVSKHQQASECVAYYQAQNMSQQAIDAKCGIRRR